ncbi:MAG: acyltransferase family protein [Planctomycetota bacterium]|jgi:membrane-bound acyltransferase YfiQ involved in biofilm formation
MDRLQTEQLKGLAIFLIVLGHLWVHLSQAGARLVLSGDAVAMFLILSGFGLTISRRRKKTSFTTFYLRRIKRIFVPYWIATSVILLCDYVMLEKLLSPGGVLMTVVGANFTGELRHLDHVRWFITFILMWYVLFWFIHNICPKKGFVPCLFLLACPLFVANYYWLDFGYHYFAFPVGCMLAVHSDKIKGLLARNRRACSLISLVVILCVLTLRFLADRGSQLEMWPEAVPTILLKLLTEGSGIVLCISAIVLISHIGESGRRSKLLLFLGKYAYEICLLHGVLLVKYNPIIRNTGSLDVIAEFALFLALLAALSVLLSKSSEMFGYAKATVRDIRIKNAVM